MDREELRNLERLTIVQLLRYHPAILLEGQVSVGLLQTFEALSNDVDPTKSSILDENHPDIHFIDSRQIKTEDLRQIRSQLTLSPAILDNRYLIIYAIDQLNYVAAQVLLKLIEEPPSKLKMIFLTDRMYLVPQTIISRSFLFKIAQPNKDEIEDILISKNVDEFKWRTQFASGDLEVALNANTELTKEWFKFWQICLAGTPPFPEFPFIWAQIFQDTDDYTKKALWNLLIQVSIKKPDNKYWREISLASVKERERCYSSRSNKITTINTLVKIYAYTKTFSLTPNSK